VKKLNIVYRGCNLEDPNTAQRSGRPANFSKIDCFNTLDRAIKNYDNVGKIIIIIDGARGYLSDFIQHAGYDVQYVSLNSNAKSLQYCYDVANQLDDLDNLYFVEDDYWHLPNALHIINEGVEMFGLVTGYDHRDRYTQQTDITYGQEYIFLSDSSHWRSAESTTCTWAASREVYEQIHTTASQHLLNDRSFFRTLITQNGLRLFTPIPAVSTHMMEDYISPFFICN